LHYEHPVAIPGLTSVMSMGARYVGRHTLQHSCMLVFPALLLLSVPVLLGCAGPEGPSLHCSGLCAVPGRQLAVPCHGAGPAGRGLQPPGVCRLPPQPLLRQVQHAAAGHEFHRWEQEPDVLHPCALSTCLSHTCSRCMLIKGAQQRASGVTQADPLNAKHVHPPPAIHAIQRD
jgi:hypothetical protein